MTAGLVQAPSPPQHLPPETLRLHSRSCAAASCSGRHGGDEQQPSQDYVPGQVVLSSVGLFFPCLDAGSVADLAKREVIDVDWTAQVCHTPRIVPFRTTLCLSWWL